MLLRVLASASELLIRSTDGMIHFFSELLPSVGKLIFVSSPLVLAVIFSYIAGGFWISLATLIVVILLYAVGAASAVRSPQAKAASELSRRVLTAVIIFDSLLVLSCLISIQYRDVVEPPRVTEPPSSDITPFPQEQSASAKATAERVNKFSTAFSKALGAESGPGYFNIDLLQIAVSELRSMNSLESVNPQHVARTLAYCRKIDETIYQRGGTCKDIVPILIQVAVESDMQAACDPLLYLRGNRQLEEKARIARHKICSPRIAPGDK